MSSAKRLERVAVGGLALAAVLAGSTSHAQVPVIDNARQKIQQATLNWYQGYQADTRKLKGASGGTADSVAPGQGSGAPDDCSADGMAGGTAPAAPAQRTPSHQEVASMVEDEAIRQSVDPNFALAIAEQESRLPIRPLCGRSHRRHAADARDSRSARRQSLRYTRQHSRRREVYQATPGDVWRPLRPDRRRLQCRPISAVVAERPGPQHSRDPGLRQKVSAYYARNKAQNGDRTPTQGAGEPETVSYGNGCGEQIKKAVDRNTQAQVERGSVWNELLGKSTEANQQYLQRLKAGLQSSSASLRGTGGGNAKDYDGSLAMAQIQCPTNIIDTGGTRCFAVPSSASTEQIQRWLFDLQGTGPRRWQRRDFLGDARSRLGPRNSRRCQTHREVNGQERTVT